MAKTKKSDQAEEPKQSRESVTLIVKRGTPAGPEAGYTRTFSTVQHGDDFEQHAKAWAQRFGAEEVAD